MLKLVVVLQRNLIFGQTPSVIPEHFFSLGNGYDIKMPQIYWVENPVKVAEAFGRLDNIWGEKNRVNEKTSMP